MVATLLAALAGLGTSALFTSVLHWPRDRFVLAHLLIVASFTLGYVKTTGLTVGIQVRRRWPAGLVVGVLVGTALYRTVLQQPLSATPSGGSLVFSLVWLGVLYGAADAILLTVIPVLSVYGTQPQRDLTRAGHRARSGALALAGSLVVTAAYHLGFVEFRGPALLAPLVGNAVITAGYLLSGNPVAPVVAHVIMHLAAVIHGLATAVQLPPHYGG